MRLYFFRPALLQTPSSLLRLAPAATDMHCRDVAESHFDFRPGFDVEWLCGRRRLDFLSILSNPQIEATLRSHRHHEADVQRALRGGKVGCELAHGCKRGGKRDGNRCTRSG